MNGLVKGLSAQLEVIDGHISELVKTRTLSGLRACANLALRSQLTLLITIVEIVGNMHVERRTLMERIEWLQDRFKVPLISYPKPEESELKIFDEGRRTSAYQTYRKRIEANYGYAPTAMQTKEAFEEATFDRIAAGEFPGLAPPKKEA